MRKIGVIGGGPVGLTLAAHLSVSGNEVTLCELSKASTEYIDKNGISIEGLRNFKTSLANTINNVEDFGNIHIDVLFICIKAYALAKVCSSIQKIYTGETMIVSWQNGIDTEKVIAGHLGAQNIFRAVVNQGVTLLNPGTVSLTFEHAPYYIKETHSGQKDTAEKIANLLSLSGIKTERSEDLTAQVWRKTIMNASFGGLCALTGVSLNEAMEDTNAYKFISNVMKECILVAEKNGILLGEDYFSYAMNYNNCARLHKPSIATDIEAGLRTEIDFFNGKIQEYGRLAGISTPYNDSLVYLIKVRENLHQNNKRVFVNG